MVAALIQPGEVNLTRWIPYLPCRRYYVQSEQRQVRRWLNNSRINIHRLDKPTTWLPDKRLVRQPGPLSSLVLTNY